MKIILEWPPELELNIEVIMSRYNFTSKQEAIEFAVKELAANSANTARRVMLNQLVGLGKKYEINPDVKIDFDELCEIKY